MAALIGITGGIGSGKSTIVRALQSLGYPVYYTDVEAMRLIQTSKTVKHAIRQLFGKEAYTENGYNKAFVAQQIFTSPDLLQKLNAIVHPAVRCDLIAWYQQQNTIGKYPYAFVESAILFESGLDMLCNATINVSAPIEIRIERTMQRDGLTREQVESRIKNQLTDAERTARSTFTIINDGRASITSLIQHTLTTLNNLTTAKA